MIPQSLAVFLPAAAAGFGLVHLFWDNLRPSALALKAFLGIPLGLGLTSCLYFFRLLLLPGQSGWMLIQVGLLLAAVLALLARRGFRFSPPSRIPGLTPLRAVLALTVILALLMAGNYALLQARLLPHGDYDAQAIWNLRSRFIYRLGDGWRGAFAPGINRNFHMDYPLLVPLNNVGAWNTLGVEERRVPAAQGMLFMLATAGVLLSALTCLRAFPHGALTLVVLLATPAFLRVSTFQTADIPLACFFLIAVVMLLLAHREASRGALFLAGLAAALSAWTKNEGQPFLLIMAIFSLALAPRGQRGRDLAVFSAGTALPLLTLLAFRLTLPAASDLLSGSLPALLSRLTDLSRVSLILRYLLPALIGLGEWPVSLIVLLGVFLLIGGAAPRPAIERFVWMIPVLQFLAYLLVYLLTPNDLEWQLKYSLDRLLLQILPMSLLACFLYVRMGEEKRAGVE